MIGEKRRAFHVKERLCCFLIHSLCLPCSRRMPTLPYTALLYIKNAGVFLCDIHVLYVNGIGKFQHEPCEGLPSDGFSMVIHPRISSFSGRAPFRRGVFPFCICRFAALAVVVCISFFRRVPSFCDVCRTIFSEVNKPTGMKKLKTKGES